LLHEGDTSTSSTTSQNAISNDQTSTLDLLQGFNNKQNDAATASGNSQSLLGQFWTPNWFPSRTGVCSIQLSVFTGKSVTLDTCNSRDSWMPFLEYLMWIFTAMGVWSIAMTPPRS
jgi:hypothetical protein